MIVDNFYPRSPCGERRLPLRPRAQRDRISIHALLAESDSFHFVASSHSVTFLSTLSLRRATVGGDSVHQPKIISIHALLAESDQEQRHYQHCLPISIHALLAESDVLRDVVEAIKQGFLSTLSLRRATAAHLRVVEVEQFLSTLSLRRATKRWRKGLQANKNFYPRSPCGERPVIGYMASFEYLFLSTLSLRRATSRSVIGRHQSSISIHALLAESDKL